MNRVNKKIILISLLMIIFLMFNAIAVSSYDVADQCKEEPLLIGGGLGAHCGDPGEPACQPGLKCWYAMCLAPIHTYCTDEDDCNGPCDDSVITCGPYDECCGRHALPCQNDDDCCPDFYCSGSSNTCRARPPFDSQCACGTEYDLYYTYDGQVEFREDGSCTNPSCGTAEDCQINCDTNLACHEQDRCTSYAYLFWKPRDPHKQLCYTFTADSTQTMKCDIEVLTSCFGLSSGLQIDEKIEILVNGASIDVTDDPYCNDPAPPECRMSGPYTTTFNDVLIDVQEGVNSLTLKSVQDSVSLEFFVMNCEPYTFCGDGFVDFNDAEECEYPFPYGDYENNQYCEHSSTEDCNDNNQYATRDRYGNCDILCRCEEDGFSDYKCVPGKCGAVCDSDDDCNDYCDGDTRYFSGNCNLDAGCSCSYSSENCNDNDGWYNTGNKKWVDVDQCNEKERKEQEYRDYSCGVSPGGVDCEYTVSRTRWLDTGNTRYKTDGTTCNDGLFCSNPDVCTDGVCGGADMDCSYNDFGKLEGCDYIPDDFHLTWDVSPGFTSVCDEENDLCTAGTRTWTHVCADNDMFDSVPYGSGCDAECDEDIDCDDNNDYSIDTCNFDTCACEYEYQPFCGNDVIDENEDCELPNTFDNDYCVHDTTEQCASSGKKLGTRGVLGDCSAACGCVDEPFVYECVEGKCGADCDSDADCNDDNEYTVDTCNLDSCGCEYEELPYCGNEEIDSGEDCELPNTFDNDYCAHDVNEQCDPDGNMLGTRDDFGNCNAGCGCVFDDFEYSCVADRCGAECAVNSDCDDGDELTSDSCNLENCGCEYEDLPYCGNNIMDPGEECDGGTEPCYTLFGYAGIKTCEDNCTWGECEPYEYCGDEIINGEEVCELPGTDNNTYCEQSTEGDCVGAKTQVRDGFGQCGSVCNCIDDLFEPVCVIGSCGAECVVDNDCDDSNDNTIDTCNADTCGCEYQKINYCEDYNVYLDNAQLDSWCNGESADVTFEANFSDDIYAFQESCSNDTPNYVYLDWYDFDYVNVTDIDVVVEHKETSVEAWLEYFNGTDWVVICDLPQVEEDTVDSCELVFDETQKDIYLRLGISQTGLCHEELDQAYLSVTVCEYPDLPDSCDLDSDCPFGFLCVDDECVLDDGDNESDDNETGGNETDPECTLDLDCDEGFVCTDDICVIDGDDNETDGNGTGGNETNNCTIDADCLEGFTCLDNECVELEEEETPVVTPVTSSGGGGGGGGGGGSFDDSRYWICDDWSPCINGEQTQECKHSYKSGTTKTNTQECEIEEFDDSSELAPIVLGTNDDGSDADDGSDEEDESSAEDEGLLNEITGFTSGYNEGDSFPDLGKYYPVFIAILAIIVALILLSLFGKKKGNGKKKGK